MHASSDVHRMQTKRYARCPIAIGMVSDAQSHHVVCSRHRRVALRHDVGGPVTHVALLLALLTLHRHCALTPDARGMLLAACVGTQHATHSPCSLLAPRIDVHGTEIRVGLHALLS